MNGHGSQGAARGPRVAHVSVIHRDQDPRIHRKQCLTLARAGYDVHLLAGGLEEGRSEGVRLHPVSPDGRRPPLRRQAPRQLAAARLSLGLRARIYHLHDPHLIPLGLALKLRGALVIYDVHEHYPLHARAKLAGHPLRASAKTGTWRAFEAAARRSFDAFVCASDALAERFPPERTIVVGNMPILSEFDELPPLPDRPPDALYLGCARPDRGVHALAEAARYLPPELGARLRFVGELRPAGLAGELTSLPWADRIEIEPERRDRAWIGRQLAAASVGVAVQTPTLNAFEGWRSNKLFEYMAAGLPVVVPDAPGWKAVVDRYECGVAVPHDDPAAIGAAITGLLTDRERAQRLGDNGRAAVENDLNWDVEADRLLALYRSLLGEPGDRARGLDGRGGGEAARSRNARFDRDADGDPDVELTAP